MIVFLAVLPRGATILPTMGNLLTPVDLVKQLFGIAFLERSVNLLFGKRNTYVFLQVFNELFLWIRWGSACFA